MNFSKKVAIVILGYNSRPHLPECLASLEHLNYAAEQYQIFFFDNASSDDSAAYVQNNFPKVKVIVNETNLGFAAGNNKAAQLILAEGFDYILLINDDTISDPDCLAKLVAVAEAEPKAAAVQARLMLYPDKDKINSLGNQFHYLGFGYSLQADSEFNGDLTVREVAYGSGAALLIKTAVIRQIGLFQEDFFMYHEDLDFGWRSRLAGYKILLAPEAVVYHKYKFAKSVRQYYWMERNRFICVLKNYKVATLILIFPALLAMELGLFVFSLKSGFWREKLKVYAYFLRLSSWRQLAAERKKVQKLRTVNDREVVRLFSGLVLFQQIDNWVLKKIANPIFNLYWLIIKSLIIW